MVTVMLWIAIDNGLTIPGYVWFGAGVDSAVLVPLMYRWMGRFSGITE